MADASAQEQKKKRTFRKFVYRGVDLEQLLEMNEFNNRSLYFMFLNFKEAVQPDASGTTTPEDEPWTEPQTQVASCSFAKGETECARADETRMCEDALARHDCVARDGRMCCRHSQRKGLQPGKRRRRYNINIDICSTQGEQMRRDSRKK